MYMMHRTLALAMFVCVCGGPIAFAKEAAIAFIAESRAELAEYDRVVNEKVLKRIDKPESWDSEFSTENPFKFVKSKNDLYRHQLYVGFGCEHVLHAKQKGFIIAKCFNEIGGETFLKEVALRCDGNDSFLNLTAKGTGALQIELLYSIKPEFREGMYAYPELSEYKAQRTQYFNGQRFDRGATVEPLRFELSNEWKSFRVPFTKALIQRARMVRAGVVILNALNKSFQEGKPGDHDAKMDRDWDPRVLNNSDVRTAVAQVQKDLGPFEFRIESGGKTVIGDDEFSPSVEKHIHVRKGDKEFNGKILIHPYLDG